MVMIACVMTVSPLYAQPEEAVADEIKPGEEIFQIVSPKTTIKMIHLDTRVIELANRIKIVDGFNSQILSVNALSPHRIRLHAESPGVTTVKLIDELDSVYVIEIFVEPDTRELQSYLERLFPGTAVKAIGLKDGVVLRGWVTDPTQIPQIIDIAEQFYPIVHSQMNVGGVTQVQLHVKILEIQRSKIRDLGFNFLALGQQYAVASTPGGIAGIGVDLMGGAAMGNGPFGGPPGVSVAAGDAEFKFAITGSSNVFQGFLKALQSEALAKVLAEPILVTTSGRPASMLSGGEFPVLVPQGLGATGIEWKKFGVSMEVVPIVLDRGRLRLDIAPEVSVRDFSNGVNIEGLVVPGVAVRRVNTQVEMRFGETLMIGGLISTARTGTTQKVPFLGELPWIGAAFSRKTFTDTETELVILVTPQMVAPMGPGQVPAGGPGLYTDTPTDHELYLDGLLEVPLYGPECGPNGACETQLIQPGYVPSTIQPQAPPSAVIDPAQNLQQIKSIQPVSGVNPTGRSVRPAEYSFSVNADRSRTNPATVGRETTNDARLSPANDRLGLIEPTTSQQDTKSTTSPKTSRRGSWFGK